MSYRVYPYTVTAAPASASSGKAKAQHDMSNLPSRKKFMGHAHDARTRAIDSDASVGDTERARSGEAKLTENVSLTLPSCRSETPKERGKVATFAENVSLKLPKLPTGDTNVRGREAIVDKKSEPSVNKLSTEREKGDDDEACLQETQTKRVGGDVRRKSDSNATKLSTEREGGALLAETVSLTLPNCPPETTKEQGEEAM